MEKITFEKLLQKVKDFKRSGISWHHHFLTPKCYFNKSDKFCIVLENEEKGEAFYAEFDKKPMDKLEVLENLFFDR